MGRVQTEERLKGFGPGAYLFRKSETKGEFSLSAV
jgi:hypothetical protein